MVPEGLMLDGDFEAVVIGGSAGAVDALAELLPSLPRSPHLAVIVVVHLPANQKSLMVEIFKPRCAFEVREAADKIPIETGTIWFAPPDYHLLVESDRTFALSIDAHVCFSRPAIDVLFESAAAVYGERLLGIVLTGASRDGAHGAKAIRERGGTVIVQDPQDAATSVMPAAAIEEANPQVITSLDGITRVLTQSLSREQG